MAVTALTEQQHAAVGHLVAAGRVQKAPIDARRAATFLNRANDAIADARRLQHAHTAYNVAYDAIHDIGESTLAAYGYRTKSGKGQHEALGRFLRVIFEAPEERGAVRTFDQLRRARNANRYDARPVGKAEVAAAMSAASDLMDAARRRGVGT